MQGARAPTLAVKLNPACPAAKKKRMQTIWGEISQESDFPPWHTFQYCCATLRSFEKIPPREQGPWPQKWAPPAGDGARWAHWRGGPQQRARGRRETDREKESLSFFCFSDCVTDRRRNLRGLGRARRGPEPVPATPSFRTRFLSFPPHPPTCPAAALSPYLLAAVLAVFPGISQLCLG